MAARNALAFADDIGARLRFERDARRAGIPIKWEIVGSPALVRYRFPIEVPVYDERREVSALIARGRPIVYIDGPRCLRHRFLNDSICMWLEEDPPEKRWMLEDGLIGLVGHAREHAYCEAECRAGRPWPKEEAPGSHPRKRNCPSCQGSSSHR
jgi:hypothetical protein